MQKLLFLTLLIVSTNAFAFKVAVTDLTYSERVEGYIHVVDYHNKSKINASSSERYHDNLNSSSGSSRDSLSASSQTDFFEYEQNYSFIELGELRKFTGDIKGEMIKSGSFQLIQAKPVTKIKDETIYDIIGRIKKGYYPGADYVLFGTVSDIDFSNDVYQAQGNGRPTATESFTLTLTAEFSLVNTKNYQVIASFSATGQGTNTKIQSEGTYAKPNRAQVVSEVSKTLGQDVIKQLLEQYQNIDPQSSTNGYLIENESTVTQQNKSVVVFH